MESQQLGDEGVPPPVNLVLPHHRHHHPCTHHPHQNPLPGPALIWFFLTIIIIMTISTIKGPSLTKLSLVHQALGRKRHHHGFNASRLPMCISSLEEEEEFSLSYYPGFLDWFQGRKSLLLWGFLSFYKCPKETQHTDCWQLDDDSLISVEIKWLRSWCQRWQWCQRSDCD